MENKLLDLINSAWTESGNTTLFSGFINCHGGSINDVLLLQNDGYKVIVKVNVKEKFKGMFMREAEGLAALNLPGSPRVPKVLGIAETEKHQFLFLQYLEPGAPVRNRDAILGIELSCLHRHTSEIFGWQSSNYIGSLIQQNEPETNAVDFFIRQRLHPQLELAAENGYEKLKVSMQKLYLKLPDLLPSEKASLIHGDLWSGNRISGPDGRWAIIDPAVSYSSREADLAMTYMFGSFGNDFLDAYQSSFPLVPGFQNRVNIWNLYPLLVHLNLFGSSYLPSIQNTLNEFS